MREIGLEGSEGFSPGNIFVKRFFTSMPKNKKTPLEYRHASAMRFTRSDNLIKKNSCGLAAPLALSSAIFNVTPISHRHHRYSISVQFQSRELRIAFGAFKTKIHCKQSISCALTFVNRLADPACI